MTSFYKPIVTLLFGLLLSGYLWIRNEMSDKWIVLFGATAIAQQLLESLQSLFINNVSLNSIISIVSYILFLIHPILNILGSYTQMENGISFEPIVLCFVFIFYKLFVNPIKLNEFFTTYDKGGYIANWFSKINKYELIAYFAMFAPAGTPRDIILKLNQAVNSASKDKDIQERFSSLGFETAPGSPEALGERNRLETIKWTRAILEAKIEPQ
jgi:hypothetical protein